MVDVMELLKVIITNRDSCKTYSLRRLGLDYLIDWKTDTPTINDLITSNKFININEPEKGSILIWTENDYLQQSYQPHHIDKNGYIFSIKRYNYGHCAIYEGNNMISECCVENGKSILKLRKYNDIKKPNFILKYIKDE
jgi:hypothetical protein